MSFSGPARPEPSVSRIAPVVLGALAAGLSVFAVLTARVEKPFRNPIAYAMAGDAFYVLEKEGNTILRFDRCGFRSPLRLDGRYRVEPDDGRYYYMARKLYPGPSGLVVQSYIHDRKTHDLAGYRFREYASFHGPPRDLLTVFLKEPSAFPEFKYACDGAGNHYFVNNCAGFRNIWKLPAGAGPVTVAGDRLPPEIRELGDRNDALSGWPSICVGPDGRIYVSSVASGRIVEYAPDGRRLREIGSAGLDEGELLAPNEVFFFPFAPGRPPCLTVANAANRSWVQFDASGAVARTVSPLQAGYPYPDILVGRAFAPSLLAEAAPGGGLRKICSFDLVNKCVLIHGRRIAVINGYRAWECSRICWLVAAAVVLLLVAAGWRRLRAALGRMKIPFFVKLLALFIPLLVASLLVVGDWVRDEMQVSLEAESIRRAANLARAILNSVSVADLEAIRAPEDRNGAAYERVYKTVARIVDVKHVEQTPKWIIHKIRGGRFYFGISIWRGPIYEPFVVPHEREMFFKVLRDKTPQQGRFTDEQGEWFSVLHPIANAAGEVIYVLELYRPTEGMDRAQQGAFRQALQIAGGTALAAILLVFLFSYVTTRPLRQLMQATDRLGRGDFEHPIVVRSRDELRDLAGAFNHMMVDLKRHIVELARSTAEKERVQSELRFAREVQQGIVPKVFPPFPEAPNVEIVARMEPAREVGGDYFDFFMIDPDHLGVVIADVSDKGVPAGLFTMIVRTLLRVNAKGNLGAADAVSRMNRQIAADNPSSMFVTLFYFIADLRTGRVVYCNAGHPPPVRLGREGMAPLAAAEGQGGGVIAGIYDQAEYSEGELVLAPGETLVLYTDGVTEAINRAEQMYGEARLLRVLAGDAGRTARQQCDRVVADVMAHQAGVEQFDDITLLFFRFLGPRPGAPEPPAPAARGNEAEKPAAARRTPPPGDAGPSAPPVRPAESLLPSAVRQSCLFELAGDCPAEGKKLQVGPNPDWEGGARGPVRRSRRPMAAKKPAWDPRQLWFPGFEPEGTLNPEPGL